MALPDRAVISFSDITSSSALISWKPRDPLEEENSPITSYNLQIKDPRGSSIVQQNFLSNTTSYSLKNLDANTDYRVFVFIRNRFGRSEDQRSDFKTLKTDIPITLSSQAQIILNKFDNGDYIISEGVNNGIELVKNGSISSELFVSTFQNLLDSGLIVDKTITVTPITHCVNIYTLDSGGNVLSHHYESITQQKVDELKQTQLVVECNADYLPTEQQVRDFYGYTAPVVDSSINTTMVSQLIGTFILKDGRVKGQIMYITNEAQYNNNNKLISGFNPFYYSKTKNLTSFVQIKSKTGIPIAAKPNGLSFTQTEKDEIIHIDEAVGNFKELIIDFLVLKSPNDMRAFASPKQIQVVEELPEDPIDPKPTSTCQIGFHKDFSGKCVPDDPIGELPRDKLIDTLKGFLFGTVALSLLARKY